ncbi:sugar phosphate isomerase/epimerase, partial [Pirellulales bacterium]|nr:sugar phosphate isomerase/epimerase [Pirellulales bacterium]
MTRRPRLAAFPKAYVEQLCSPTGMTLREWIDLAGTLGIPGLEFYCGIQELQDPANWPVVRRMVEDSGMTVAMLCCSPDFTHPDLDFRQRQIDLEKHYIDMAAALGAQ